MKIIPAIDIIGGKCVRLEKGDYSQQKTYFDDPLEVALLFESHGIKYLHLVDLDGAKKGDIVNWKVLEKIASKTNLHIDFGGGVKSDEALKIAFNSGAKQITAGSIAVKNPEKVAEWLQVYGPKKIILGADVKEEQIAISGWQETAGIDIWTFLENYRQKGVKNVICTDISKDGMLQGTAIELYRKILDRFPGLQLVASGGVTHIDELDSLQQTGVAGVIIGKAIYENKITLKDLENYVS